MIPLKSQPTCWVTIEPAGRKVAVPAGTTILAAARAAGVQVNAVCGGKGTCEACKVLVVNGEFSPPSTVEKNWLQQIGVQTGLRLACQTTIHSDAKVQFPPESLATQQLLQLEGQHNPLTLHPAVQRIDLSLGSTIGAEKQSTAEKVREALKINGFLHTDLPDDLLLEILNILHLNENRVSLVLFAAQLIAVLPPNDHMLGLAVDIGTTKLAAFLVDLQTGHTLASAGVVNPQIAYGEDVLSRIQYTDEYPEGAHILQKELVRSLNTLIGELIKQTGVAATRIVDCVMVGNTAMHHLLAGLPVHSLGTAPYRPARINSMSFPAEEIGLCIAGRARVYLPPNVAGFVGGDHIAMLLATQAEKSLQTVAAMDIGTNTEISLVHKGRHLVCSCASGPAFEGAHIRNGVRAIPGAIERVFIDGNEVKIQTIEDQPAVGICGSGILDVVAELRKVDLIDSRGAFVRHDPRLTVREGKTEFVLVQAEMSGSGS